MGAAGSQPSGSSSIDIFTLVDRSLNGSRTRVIDLFREFDKDRNNSLDRFELNRFIRRLVPTATSSEIACFSVIVDLDRNARVSYKELVQTVRSVAYAGKRQGDDNSPTSRQDQLAQPKSGKSVARFEGGFDLETSIHALRRRLAGTDAEKLLRGLDNERPGYVHLREIVRLLRKLLISPPQIRILASTLRCVDGSIARHELIEMHEILVLPESRWSSASFAESISFTSPLTATTRSEVYDVSPYFACEMRLESQDNSSPPTYKVLLDETDELQKENKSQVQYEKTISTEQKNTREDDFPLEGPMLIAVLATVGIGAARLAIKVLYAWKRPSSLRS